MDENNNQEYQSNQTEQSNQPESGNTPNPGYQPGQYGPGYQPTNNYSNNNNNNKKKSNKGKIAAIVIACVAAAGLVIAIGVSVIKTFITAIGTYPGAPQISQGGPEVAGQTAEPEETAKPVETVTVGNYSGNPVDVSDIVEAAMPCVVQITSTTSVQGYSIFGEPINQQASSCGTGFIVGQNDTELLLATNNHVVEDATAIQVTFADGKTAEAITKGTDAQADLAVVAVKVKDIEEETFDAIKVAVLGDSEKTKVGQMAIAIGNAQGMGQSVTVGYISAKDRELDMQDNQNGGTRKMSFIQTDAAINGGNSGGPLLNTNGEVVGINSAKISSTDVEGMCYAIPISTAIPIINELMNRETLTEEEKGYLGVSLTDINEEAVEMYGVPDGVYINKIVDKGPAEKAGLEVGDIIIEINGTVVNSSSAAVDKITSNRAGTEVTVKYCRRKTNDNGYDTAEVKVTLASAEDLGINTKNQSPDQSQNQGQNPDQNPNQDPNDDYGYGYGGGNGEHDFNSDDFKDYIDRFFNW